MGATMPARRWRGASPRVILVLTGFALLTAMVPISGWSDDSAAAPANGHRGPVVAPATFAPTADGAGPEFLEGAAPHGPARFAAPLLELFSRDDAMAVVRFADRFYREPGNDGFEATLDEVLRRLREAGLGAAEEGSAGTTTLEEIVTPRTSRAWTPVRARLSLVIPGDGKGEETLLAFDAEDDRHRTMLPSYAPSGDVTGRIVLHPNDVEPGDVLLTDQGFGGAVARALAKQAAAVIIHRLADYHVDPTGRERHLDAIPYSKVPDGTTVPVAQVSKRIYDRLVESVRAGEDVRVRLRAEVKWDERPLRTVVLTFLGAEQSDEVVPIACHVQEPGAVDNASGVGGFVAAALALERAIASGRVPRPKRSVAVIWGLEMTQSRVYLDHTKKRVVAALSADMIGASRERTGAMPLLEREPDPGALDLLPPDEHTPWGAGRVRESQLRPSGLSIIARCALRDVAVLVGGWETAEHPWEGGSDHDIFLRRNIPALLLWNFTDFAYHTSLDRVEHVDPETLRRMSCAILATALSVADLRESELPRYRACLELDRALRLEAAKKAERFDVAERWATWFEGVDAWFEATAR